MGELCSFMPLYEIYFIYAFVQSGLAVPPRSLVRVEGGGGARKGGYNTAGTYK